MEESGKLMKRKGIDIIEGKEHIGVDIIDIILGSK
jgi:hypothetical protein